MTMPDPATSSSSRAVADISTSGGDAQVVVATDRFAADLAALTGEHGFRVESIFPADAPTTAVVSGHGLRLRLEGGRSSRPVTIHLVIDNPPPSRALPGGSRIEFLARSTGYILPDNDAELVFSHPDSRGGVGGVDGVGRAGMHYRDLIPGRWGGRFVASQITIADGGPVADYVHFHRLRFQMIYVKAGWVRLVYEDQGEPFVMVAGDCVLQPPEIRHRVLEASRGMEVIEVGCPALHETVADWSLPLPTPLADPRREWDGQRFTLHTAAASQHLPWRAEGWEYRDAGIGDATHGLAGVRIARRSGPTDTTPIAHASEFALMVVVAGSVTFATPDHPPTRLINGASVAIPGGLSYTLTDPSSDCELLDVTLPELRP